MLSLLLSLVLAAPIKLDPNQATVQELLTIPGMTTVWANRIVRFRPYRTKMELLHEGVLSPTEYERVKDYLVVHRN